MRFIINIGGVGYRCFNVGSEYHGRVCEGTGLYNRGIDSLCHLGERME